MTMHRGLVDQSDKFKKRVASANTSSYKVVSRNQLVVGFPIDEGVLAFQNLYEKAVVSPAYDIWELVSPKKVHYAFLGRFLRSPFALSFYAAKLR
jgi:type I restriction enzyme S subunit